MRGVLGAIDVFKDEAVLSHELRDFELSQLRIGFSYEQRVIRR